MEGFISLEEVDPEHFDFKTSLPLKSSSKKQKSKSPKPLPKEKITKGASPKSLKETTEKCILSNDQCMTTESPWFSFYLHPLIQRALLRKGFISPTEIQKEVLGRLVISIDSHSGLAALDEESDILASAPTGSGKTLAFGLPIIHSFLCLNTETKDTISPDITVDQPSPELPPIAALILVPTRELGIQVSVHLLDFVNNSPVRVACLIGGISDLKQMRLLGQKVDILIATPGRLQKWIQEDKQMIRSRLGHLRFLIVDEVDRMLEPGHFKDLDDIFGLIKSNYPDLRQNRDKRKNKLSAQVMGSTCQTFVFSATLPIPPSVKKFHATTVNCQFDRQEKITEEGNSKEELLKQVLLKIPFQKSKPIYLQCGQCPPKDNKDGTVGKSNVSLPSSIAHFKITCVDKEKDLYLYNLLLHTAGRTIIFVNSIDTIRRLVPLLKNLQLDVFPIHSQMPQRQRLKNFDRFSALTVNGVMVASELASRGLDFPLVDFVIHYQLPRTNEIYIHRAGRTGRAGAKGVSISVVTPSEFGLFQKLSHNLSYVKEAKEFPLDTTSHRCLQDRLFLALEIDQMEHSLRKKGRDNWTQKASRELDIDVDDKSDTDAPFPEGQLSENDKKKIKQLKNRLTQLILSPIVKNGSSRKRTLKQLLNSSKRMSI